MEDLTDQIKNIDIQLEEINKRIKRLEDMKMERLAKRKELVGKVVEKEAARIRETFMNSIYRGF